MKRLILIIAVLTQCALAQTTSYYGVIKDLTGSLVTSGKVTYTLRPSNDVTLSGVARFSPSTVTCPIAVTGNVVGLANTNVTSTSGTTGPGTSVTLTSATGFAIGQQILIAGAGAAGANYVGAITNVVGAVLTISPGTSTSVSAGAAVYTPCQVTMNTALQPPGSGYLISFWPANVKTATIFAYALNALTDISTVVSTQAQLPNQGGVVDTFSNQTISGQKTLTNPILQSPTTTGTDAGTETLQNKTLTSPTVNTPTLTSPTTTGTDSGTETMSNKTLTAPVVTSPTTTGTDNGAEALQNKTLTGAGSGNNVTSRLIVSQQATQTGSGAAQAITGFTYTIPANTVSASSLIRIFFVIAHASGSASVTYSVDFGDVSGTTVTNTNTSSLSGMLVITKGVNSNANLFSMSMTTWPQNGNATSGAIATSATTVSQSCALTMKFNVANTDTVVPQQFIVEQVQ